MTPARGSKCHTFRPPLFSGEAVLEQRGDEYHWPLHALLLVHRHDADRIRVGVLVVLPALGRVALGAILEEVGERSILLRRLRVKVDRLEVRNKLAELAQVIEGDLAASVWDALLANARILENRGIIEVASIFEQDRVGRESGSISSNHSVLSRRDRPHAECRAQLDIAACPCNAEEGTL
jgi:hypothetical protein